MGYLQRELTVQASSLDCDSVRTFANLLIVDHLARLSLPLHLSMVENSTGMPARQ
jgi:hypothetical protein